MTTLPRAFSRALPIAALACAIGFAAPSSASAQDYYSDVRPLLVNNCLGCHTEEGPGWSMEDAERTYNRGRRIARAVESRRMPPWLAEPGHQEYMGDLSLEEDKIAMIREWADAGFPKGDPRPDPAPMMTAGMMEHHAFAPEVSVDVLPDEGYLPNQEWSDDYRCFVAEWPEDEAGYVTGFRANVGNRSVGHHLVVFSVDGALMDRYREVDEMYGDGPGYTCFGGTLPDEIGRPEDRAAYEERYPDGLRELSRASAWLAHWAPGMDGHVFPEGTGIYMEPGDGLVVQMHYYGSNAPGERDVDTSMEFMMAPEVDYQAFNIDQTRGEWLGGEQNETMVIPAGEMRSFEMEMNLNNYLGYFSHLSGVARDRIAGLQIHSANLHMHAHGHSGEVVLRHATGQTETLLSIPVWDLGWQRDFVFTAPKVIAAEDFEDTAIRVECTYENKTEETVYGGFGSFDEMCFNFSYISVIEADPVTTTEGQGTGGEPRPESEPEQR